MATAAGIDVVSMSTQDTSHTTPSLTKTPHGFPDPVIRLPTISDVGEDDEAEGEWPDISLLETVLRRVVRDAPVAKRMRRSLSSTALGQIDPRCVGLLPAVECGCIGRTGVWQWPEIDQKLWSMWCGVDGEKIMHATFVLSPEFNAKCLARELCYRLVARRCTGPLTLPLRLSANDV